MCYVAIYALRLSTTALTGSDGPSGLGAIVFSRLTVAKKSSFSTGLTFNSEEGIKTRFSVPNFSIFRTVQHQVNFFAAV